MGCKDRGYFMGFGSVVGSDYYGLPKYCKNHRKLNSMKLVPLDMGAMHEINSA